MYAYNEMDIRRKKNNGIPFNSLKKCVASVLLRLGMIPITITIIKIASLSFILLTWQIP